MRNTKTEDLIKFGPLEEVAYHVSLYKDGAMLRVQIFHAKTKRNLEKQIRNYIDVQWPADKKKISYQIR